MKASSGNEQGCARRHVAASEAREVQLLAGCWPDRAPHHLDRFNVGREHHVRERNCRSGSAVHLVRSAVGAPSLPVALPG